MKNLFKILTLTFLLSLGLVGCGNTVSTITLNGSSSMENLARSLGEVFSELNPEIAVSTEFTGSSSGIKSVSEGSSDIGNASRHLKPSELELGLEENIVALDSIAVITDNENIVDNLTNEELIGIFTGTIRNWSEVGGNDQNIVVIGREAGSGTRDAFEEILNISDSVNYAQEINSTGAAIAKVSATPGAIGYVSLNVVDETVKVVNINNIAPTEENISSGNYLLVRPFVMVTNGTIEEQTPEVIQFFNFVYSEEGTSIIRQLGLIPLS